MTKQEPSLPPPGEPIREPKSPGARVVPVGLRELVEHKRVEVEKAKAAVSFEELEGQVAQQEPARNFFTAVTRHASKAHMAVIAEIKRQSPSAGPIRPEYAGEGFRPEDIAQRYHRGGAAAISCHTDERHYGGRLEYIQRVKEAVPLAVMRRDVLIDPWQLWESRAAGADAVVLIAECLPEGTMIDMLILAQRLGMTVLLEVHTRESLLRIRGHVGFPHPSYVLLGINNRDLGTMRVDIGHTLRLLGDVPDPTILVSESGVTSREDMRKLRKAGVRIVLIGEYLMRQEDPGASLKDLMG